MPLRSPAILVASTTVTLGVFLVRPENPRAPEPTSASSNTVSSPHSLILQASDGERRVGRPPLSDFRFTIKVDEQNGNAEDFLVAAELMAPGEAIPFHMHHNAEEVVIFEEAGASATVGNKRATAGPHSIVFIPRDTWVSITNTSEKPIHLYGLFSHQGFEVYLRAISVREGQPATPVDPAEREQLRTMGHASYWDTSKGPSPPTSENNPSAASP